MRVAEIFHSIQGEGLLAGVPSAFVRASGCNLRCVWCDTPYASWAPEGPVVSVAQIVERIAAYPTRHVVLTGGEPMIMADAGELTRRLRAGGYHITIETAGTVWAEVVCDLASVSPKLANSTPVDRDGGRFAEGHERKRINVEVVRRFMERFDYQLKFVVTEPGDLAEIDELVGRIGDVRPDRVLLMPEGVDRESLDAKAGWVADICKDRGFRYCPRLHIMMYGNVRGT